MKTIIISFHGKDDLVKIDVNEDEYENIRSTLTFEINHEKFETFRIESDNGEITFRPQDVRYIIG